MRPPRVAILVFFFSASLFLFCRSIASIRRSSTVVASSAAASAATTITTTSATNPHGSRRKSAFRSLFSFSAPFALFPPNAAISLTDDNSTSFPARPAAFGPALPSKGLSGQLWIGSGFADDNLPEGEGEGELGCSDVPGWEDGGSSALAGLKGMKKAFDKTSKQTSSVSKSKNLKRNDGSKGPVVDRKAAKAAESSGSSSQAAKYRPFDDGTDDYLHQGLQKPPGSRKDLARSGTTHADIQSIQETAEITGKVVLLSRGGCGFLEKVKWAQRRGAVAVIVGDNTKGGPLIQMFARGDTSNVSIPAIFTSHTTAHLLSSLMQPGSFIEDMIDESGNAIVKVQQADKGRKNRKLRQQQATAAAAAAAMAPGTNTNSKGSSAAAKPQQLQSLQSPRKPASPGRGDSTPSSKSQSSRGWWAMLFGSSESGSGSESKRRSNDWVLVDDWSDEKDTLIRNSLERASKKGTSKSAAEVDDFQIGVQDWRDPDLVGKGPSAADLEKESLGKQSKSGTPAGNKANPATQKEGITPGSGEYVPPQVGKSGDGSGGSVANKVEGGSAGQGGLISKIFGDDDGADFSRTETHGRAGSAPPVGAGSSGGGGLTGELAIDDLDMGEGREGLWVTITPTSSASPFFDTLLVLVISPLITLSVVYALLILRARIRRRRWRAPKSVIERLPVRTYHTVASSPSLSPRLPSPTSSSPTTPLLQQRHIQSQQHSRSPSPSPLLQPTSSSSRPRPRSRTTTGVPDSSSSGSGLLLGTDLDSQAGPSLAARPSSRSGQQPQEKADPPSQWKKYMGRQVECVVCLEEYIDGVSRVMSLPCGHEFHAECITPWLTTRRRTCPICKGDVVRSLARGAPAGPRYEPYRDDSDSDDTSGSPETSGPDNSGSDRPRSPDRGDDQDLERGILSAFSPSQHQSQRWRSRESGSASGSGAGGWLNMLSSSFGAALASSSSSTRSNRERESTEDRNR